ncbi:MAG: peptide chain release factor N(5)-glutamine methyltransferase [Clostridia bacterium]|nr:peptide chain release factor N(5)-glutamine methyltransferase [Clostridia bacterium]
MTVNELYRQGAEMLDYAFVENAFFDARWLVEKALGINSTQFALKKDKEVSKKVEVEFLSLIRRRIAGEPLQYILGEWEFMGYPFSVGEGVLIPRPETELLVDFAKDKLKDKKSPVVFDLCSGSGCIAVSVAKLFPKAKVYAVEKSQDALAYLKKNVKLNKAKNVEIINGDIADKRLLQGIVPDLILSNPPYIKSEELPTLQKEVQREPSMALDGGTDGLDFYKILAENWLYRLQKGSVMAVECGEAQAEDVSQLFFLAGSVTDTINDLSGIQRVVTATKNR